MSKRNKIITNRIKDLQYVESPELKSIPVSDLSEFKNVQLVEDSKKKAKNHQLKKNLLVAALSMVVVISGIVVNIYQSLLLSENHYYFPFPILSAAIMNLIPMILAAVCVAAYGRLGRTFALFASQDGWKAIYQAILPCSVVTAVELALAFTALRFVSVAFFTMVRSSSIIFILIGAFITGREDVNLTLISVILLTGAGVILAAWDPSSTAGLNALGFGLCMADAVLCGIKWVLTEVLLNENESFANILKQLNASSTNPQAKPRNLSALLTCLLLGPLSIAALLIGAFFMEGFPLTFLEFAQDVDWEYAAVTGGNILLSSLLIFLIRVTDFRLVQLVHLVTFSLLGIVKEIIMILISVLFLNEVLFAVNWIGLAMTIVGVGLYSAYRHQADLKAKQVKDIELTPVTRSRRQR